jgi:hypothetical protein
MNVGLVEENR